MKTKHAVETIGYYILHNKDTDETYAGSGRLEKRKYAHFNSLENNKHPNHKLQEAYNKNPNFDFIGIETESRDDALAVENAMIQEFTGNPLFLNISTSAYACRPEWTPEQRKKHGELLTGRKIHTDEHKTKMSLLMTELNNKPENKEKNRQRMLGNTHTLGYTHTEEAKEKNRIASLGNTNSLGNKHSEIAKEKIKNAVNARWNSEESEEIRKQFSEFAGELWKNQEYKEKQIKSKLGHTVTQETRDKIGAASSHSVSIDGVIYPSCKAAADVFSISSQTVINRVNNDNWPTWTYA